MKQQIQDLLHNIDALEAKVDFYEQTITKKINESDSSSSLHDSLSKIELLLKAKEESDSRIKALEQENDRLSKELKMKDSALEAIYDRLDKIESNQSSSPAPKQPAALAPKLAPAPAKLAVTTTTTTKPVASKPESTSTTTTKPVTARQGKLSDSMNPTPIYSMDDYNKGKFPTNGNPLLLDDSAFEALMKMTKDEYRASGRVKQYIAKSAFWANQEKDYAQKKF